MAFLGGLLGHRDSVRAVQAPGTAAGAGAVRQQLQMGAETASRQAAGMAGARGSTALNRFGAQQMGSQAITQANQQAGVAQQQLEQNRLNQQFAGQQQAQQINNEIDASNAAVTGKLVMGAAGTAAMMSDMRAKTDARPVPGWLGGYMDQQGEQAPPGAEPPAWLGGYAPEQSTPDRARFVDLDEQERHQARRLGLRDFVDLDEQERTLVTRYQMADVARRNQEAQGPQQAPAPSRPQGMLGELRQQMPSAYEQGYRGMRAQLGGGVPTGPMQPWEYRYRPEQAAQMGTDTGPRVGPMAQEMAQSPLYTGSVTQRQDGMLGIDRDRAQQATIAGVADLNQRLAGLEDEAGRLGKYQASREAGREAYPVQVSGSLDPDLAEEKPYDDPMRWQRGWGE